MLTAPTLSVTTGLTPHELRINRPPPWVDYSPDRGLTLNSKAPDLGKMADKDELTVSPTGNDVEKSGAVDESVIEEKSRLRIDDEVGDLAAKALTSGPVDPEMSKRVLRKIDMYILPFLCITYALQFIDKTSLGYSSVYGIIKDNNLKGQDYSWASSIFYFGKPLPHNLSALELQH